MDTTDWSNKSKTYSNNIIYECHHSLKPNRYNQYPTKDTCATDQRTIVHSTDSVQNLKYYGTKIPNISQFLGAEHENDIKNWEIVWFPKYGRDLTSTCCRWGPRWHLTTVSHSLSTTWNERCYWLLSLSVCGAVGVLLVAWQLCYPVLHLHCL